MNLSLVHHWLVGMRGGEKVLEQFCLLFPAAPIVTLVANPGRLSDIIRSHTIEPSVLQAFGGARYYKRLLPLFPAVIRSIGVDRSADFVLSSDASVIKGVRIPEGVPHLCYCHSPPRYLWELEDEYSRSSEVAGPIGRFVFSRTASFVREFDQYAAQRVTCFIANSNFVRGRIRSCYGRESTVIYPPVEIQRFDHMREREDFFLVVSALTQYKRVDIAVDACSRLGKPLVVIGAGAQEKDLRRRASDCITFLGEQPEAKVKHYMERCRAFLFPGIEDFGITPCEAQAAGAPILAYGAGGALETISEGISGLFFKSQSVDGMIEAIERFEAMPRFSARDCRAKVEHLAPRRFLTEIKDFLEKQFPKLFVGHTWPKDIFERDLRPEKILTSPNLKVAA